MALIEKLQGRIGYQFQQLALLEQALTHRSFGPVNNERLEFLGDSILNFTITEDLFNRFPEAPEGDLSRLRSGLVKRGTLAALAKELELGELLKMGTGELRSGGFQRNSILSDALEAVFGAVLLDGGVGASMETIRQLFQSRLLDLDANDLQKDSKTRLQEYLQSIGEPVPEYSLLRTTGKSPDQVFEVECKISILNPAVRSTGSSKRRAEQMAAGQALDRLGVDQ